MFISVVDGITGQTTPTGHAAPAAAAEAPTAVPPGGLIEWDGRDTA